MEWAYVAGYFDGEGNVGLHKNQERKGSYITTLTWHNSHLESLQAIQAFMGVGYLRKRPMGNFSGSKKQMYCLSISRKLDLLHAIDHMEPYLIIKREAILVLRKHLIDNVNEKRTENFGKLLLIPKEDYVRWYIEEGKSLEKIARALGVSHSGVLRVLRLHNIPRRPVGGATSARTPRSEEAKARMKASRRKLWEDPEFSAKQRINLRKGPLGPRVKGYRKPAIQGAKHPRAKLSDASVLAIRATYAAGETSLHTLADRYHVSKKTILNIVHNRIWTHIPLSPSNA